MATSTLVSTCGFLNGDANQPRTANSGFDCRVDVRDGLWGFCPTTVIAATDCGLAGNCVDAHSCFNGCGITGTAITTFTCISPGADYCSTALLIAGEDQTYSYLACASAAATVSLLAEATTTSSTSSTALASTSSTTIASTASQTSPILTSTTQHSTLSGSSIPISSITNPTPSTSSSTSSAPSSSSTSNVGAIVGGVIGGLALVCFVGLALAFLRRFRVDGHGVTRKKVAVRPNEAGDMIGGQTSEYQDAKSSSPIELSAQPNGPYELPN